MRFPYVGNNLIFTVWCETCRYQCLENLLGGLVVVVVPLFHKWPLVTLLDFVSKQYCFLLNLICSDISCFSWLYKSGPSIELCPACNSSSSWLLIFLLIILYTVLHIFHCRLSVISNLFSWNLSCTFYVQDIPISLLLSVWQIPFAVNAVSWILMMDTETVWNM